MRKIKVFSGTANLELSLKIESTLNTPGSSIPLSKATIDRFSDGESDIRLKANVFDAEVFIIQPTSHPANDHLIELLMLIRAAKTASAKRITAVIPYYGYARQDRKTKPGAIITAQLVADLIQEAGANRILTMDLHSGQIQGFFNIPVDNLYAKPIFFDDIKKRFKNNFILVSPDAGGVQRVRSHAKKLGVDIAIIDKRREEANKSEAMNVIGNVKDKKVIMLDDMVDTAGTLCGGANKLFEDGATEVHAYCTHGVLSGPAIKRIEESAIKTLTITDTIFLPSEKLCKKINILSIANVFAVAIRKIAEGKGNLSELFD